jgi:CRISPR system Cascade subunit CasE
MNTTCFHMLRMELDGAALMRFAAAQGLARVDDDGFGYTLHAWLAAVFGALAPKPFHLQSVRGPYPYVLLGYAGCDHVALMERAHAFADPLAFGVLRPESLASKLMPRSWRRGQRLRMDVLACPMTRKDSVEKDVYLRVLDRLGEAAPERPQVYGDWLRRQLDPAVTLHGVRIDSLSRVRIARRVPARGGGRRLIQIERPQVLFSALAEIRDAVAFDRALQRGVGRHRAFGFGMLLLRPPGVSD